MNRIRHSTVLQVVRGSLAVGLGSLIDPLACGELEEPARDAIETFSEAERYLDQAGMRLVDCLREYGRLPEGVTVADDVQLSDAADVPGVRLPPSLADAVHAAEREITRMLHSVGMSLGILAHRQLSELSIAIQGVDPSPERDAAVAVHSELLVLVCTVGMDRDQRRPFALLWPRVAAGVVAVAVPHHHAARASEP